MKFWIALAVLLLSTPVSAQPRPGAFTTIIATSSSATAVCVGCPIGTTTPATESSIVAASLTLANVAPAVKTLKFYALGGALFFNSATTFEIGALLRVDGLGTHRIAATGAGAQRLTVSNTTAGIANEAALSLTADGAAGSTSISQSSSTFAGGAGQLASSLTLIAGGQNGLAMATSGATATMRFITNQGATSTPMLTLYPSGGGSLGSTVGDPGAGVFGADTMIISTTAFGSLPAATNGTIQWCADCAPASNPCTGASTGSFAFRMNGAWKCI